MPSGWLYSKICIVLFGLNNTEFLAEPSSADSFALESLLKFKADSRCTIGLVNDIVLSYINLHDSLIDDITTKIVSSLNKSMVNSTITDDVVSSLKNKVSPFVGLQSEFQQMKILKKEIHLGLRSENRIRGTIVSKKMLMKHIDISMFQSLKVLKVFYLKNRLEHL